MLKLGSREVLVEVLGLLVAGSTLSWAFRKLGLSDVVGYVLGGIAASVLMSRLGLDVSEGVDYGEPLSWLGLILFFFTAGASVGSRGLLEHVHRVLAAELVLYALLWLCSGVVSRLINADHVERLILFVVLANSSTASLADLLKREDTVSQYIRERVIVQTCVEDLMQFVLFAHLLVAGSIAVGPNPIRAASQILGVVALGLVLFYVSSHLLRHASRTRFVSDKENKLVLAVGSTMLFSYIASLLGLPPLFGAFMVGVAFSKYIPLGDIEDMLNGLKSLGLLLYFTSLGARLHLKLGGRGVVGLLGVAIPLGALALTVRALGLFVVTMLVTGKVLESTYLALLLAPLSETGAVFVDVLGREGVASEELVALSTIIVLTSLVLHGLVAPRLLSRAHEVAAAVKRSLPDGALRLLQGLGEAYIKRVNVTSLIFVPTIKFTSTVLVISYLNSLCVNAVREFGLPAQLAMAAAIGSLVLILVSYVKTLGDVVSRMVARLQPRAGRIGESIEKALDVLTGLSALAVQTDILYETTSKTVKDEPLSAVLSAAIGAAVLAITAREFVRRLRAGGGRS